MPAWPSTSLSRAVTHSSECRSRFSQCGPSEARGSTGAIGLRKEVEDYLRRLVKPQPPGMPPFRTSVSLLFTAVLSRSCESAMLLAAALTRVLKASRRILNVGDRLTEGLAVTSEVGSRTLHAFHVLVRLAPTLVGF